MSIASGADHHGASAMTVRLNNGHCGLAWLTYESHRRTVEGRESSFLNPHQPREPPAAQPRSAPALAQIEPRCWFWVFPQDRPHLTMPCAWIADSLIFWWHTRALLSGRWDSFSHRTPSITRAPIGTQLPLPLQLPRRAPAMQSGPTDWPKLLWERSGVQTKSFMNFQLRVGIGQDCSSSDG